MLLHGIYNNGKIKIDEKNLPKLKAKVEIKLLEEDTHQRVSNDTPILNKLRGILKGVSFSLQEIKETRIKGRYGNFS